MHITLFCMQVFMFFAIMRKLEFMHDAIDELKRNPK